MNHSGRSPKRDLVAALGRRFIALVTMLALLAPSPGWAATPYSLSWTMHEDANSCAVPELEHEGDAFFHVNEVPLPNRITTTVRRFMDASDWFLDSRVPPELRAYVDGVLKRQFDALADEMKDALDALRPGDFDLTQTQLFQTIEDLGAAMDAMGEGAQNFVDVMGTLAHAATRIAVGFVPVVGPTLDLCECVTGREWCLPEGRELSDEERIFSGPCRQRRSTGTR